MKFEINDYTNKYKASGNRNTPAGNCEILFKNNELYFLFANDSYIKINDEGDGDFDGTTRRTGLLCITKEETLFLINTASSMDSLKHIIGESKLNSIEEEIIQSETELNKLTDENKKLKKSIYSSRAFLIKYKY